jgi:uncharacterized membrane protein
MDGADKTLKSLKQLKHDHHITYDDVIIVVKDEEGEVSILDTKHGSPGKATAKGSVVGLVAGTIMGGPVAGLLLGALAGRYVGKHAEYGISHEKVEMITAELGNGSSAIFVEVDEGKEIDVGLFRSALLQHGGTVHEVMFDDNIAGDRPEVNAPDATYLRESRS